MAFDSREFRDALGCFATGVCVVTAAPPGGKPFGLTVNSFASVSLDPPLVLWSLQNDCGLFDAFVNCPRWTVNILRAGQVELSKRYARWDHLLDAGDYEIGVSGAPVMPETLVSLECELEARHPGGDHEILVARVLEITLREAGMPLIFSSGSYQSLVN